MYLYHHEYIHEATVFLFVYISNVFLQVSFACIALGNFISAVWTQLTPVESYGTSASHDINTDYCPLHGLVKKQACTFWVGFWEILWGGKIWWFIDSRHTVQKGNKYSSPYNPPKSAGIKISPMNLI